MTAPTASDAPSARPSLAQLALGDLEHELATTRRVLERVPDASWDFRPHPKSMPLGHLAAHLANIPRWAAMTLAGPDDIDVAGLGVQQNPPATRDALLAHFDARVAEARAALAAADDASLAGRYTVRRGDRLLMSMPRAATLRTMVVSHMIHHRAQLGVYLRLLDLPVPSVYGPSADEG